MVNVTASCSPKTFAFEGSKLLLDLCLVDSRILYFWYVLKSIHKFIIELHAPQCLFEKGSNKNQRRDRIISNFTKGETFSFLMTKVLLGVISKSGPSSCTPQNRPSSPLQFGHLIEMRACWFLLKISRLFPISSSRNRMINTFVIVKVTPYPFQKGLLSPFSLARNRIYLGTHLKEELTNLLWSYQGIPYSQQAE